MDLTEMGRAAVAAKYEVQKMTAEDKNASLKAVAEGLLRDKAAILAANARDVERAERGGMHPGMVDRLRLTDARMEAMAEGLLQICGLPDPLGEVLEHLCRPVFANGHQQDDAFIGACQVTHDRYLSTGE